MKKNIALRLCRTGGILCFAVELCGIAWMGSICVSTISAPVGAALLWVIWQVAQALLAMLLIYTAADLSEQLVYAAQEIEREEYKEALYHGLISQGRRDGT